jgi:DNA-binding SARP family transcriptional activator
MRYEILGPLRVVSDDGEFVLSAHKMELLLATLLIRADHIVSVDQLATELWDGDPPRRAAAGLHVYISQLRKFLVRAGEPVGTITTRPPGYVLYLGAGEFDLLRFQEAIRAGRLRLEAGSAAEAVAILQSALSLHRGPVLGGMPGGPIVTSFAAWVEESRLECLEWLIEASLALNRHREVVSMLYPLIAEYPLRETFHHFLMLALYRSGRQAEALRVYQRAREIIVDELGLEPSRSLRELHQAILLDEHDVPVNIAV